MTRLRYVFDEARVQRFIAEGRGKGQGPAYRPWLQIQDVPSTGRSHRPHGIKSQRVHHLLSDGEWKCFLKLEGTPSVVDIQEQFPMDRLETYNIARRLGFRHPRTLDGTPYVMTLDFLVIETVPGGLRTVPFTFKYDPVTLSLRQQELMAITREFCRSHGMELQLLDQSFFDEPFNINYDSVRGYHDISQLDFYGHTDVAGIAKAVLGEISAGSKDTLLGACRWLAEAFRATPLVVFQVAMHLVSRGVLRVNLSSTVGLERLPLHAYSLAEPPALLLGGR
jgi:hypothetical protein